MAGSPLTTGGIQESFLESCRYTLNSGAPTVASGSTTVVPFDTKTFDPYNNYNTGTSKFTASVRGGCYQLSAMVSLYVTSNLAAGASIALNSVKNGSTDAQFCKFTVPTAISASGLSPFNFSLNGSTLMQVLGGDVIWFVISSNLGVTATISSGVGTLFSINRLGRIA